MTFDPNAAAANDSGIFGLPFTTKDAKLILIPIPWEVTTSYGGGTSQGPSAIYHASKQVDLFDLELGNFFEHGIAMADASYDVKQWNDSARKIAQELIAMNGSATHPHLKNLYEEVNHYSAKLNNYVYTETKKWLSQGKLVGIIGGDHSTPFGAIQAFLEVYPQMGILHIDAHADMRDAYEDFTYSHASIMHNVITKTSLNTLVQVGIRDFCNDEFHFMQANKDKVTTFFDATLWEQKLHGKNWSDLCDQIIKPLPQDVYVSFDIDGLDPRFCPHTGTPVPGGLDFNEALFLLKKVHQSGRKIIGFDLNEVSPGHSILASEVTDTAAEWDANVGARLLYKLCGHTLISTNLQCESTSKSACLSGKIA